MDDHSSPDVSTRMRYIIAACAIAVFIACIVLFMMLWPVVIQGVAP
jgi:hypothetical protein